QPVRGDLPAGLLHGRKLVGGAGERAGDAVAGNGHLRLGEQAVDPPETGARTVFVDRFHIPVPHALPGCRTRDFRQESLGGLVSVQDTVFAAFLVVDDELDRDMRAARPFRVGWIGSIAAHISLVTHFAPLPPPETSLQDSLKGSMAFPRNF